MARLGSEITGFPARSVVEYRHERNHPNRLHGHFTEWAYEHMGVFGFEIELGNLFNSLGFSTEFIFGCTREEYRGMERRAMEWHRQHPDAGIFIPWRPFVHPQLGNVEIGGWDPIGRANVLPEDREETWRKAAEFILELAGHAPALEVRDAAAEHLGARLFRVRCRIANSGGLPTHITKLGASMSDAGCVAVEADLGPGVERVCGATRVELGAMAARSASRVLEWVFRAPKGRRSEVVIRASAPRAGSVRRRIVLA